MIPDFFVELILGLENLCDIWEERLGLESNASASILVKERLETIIVFLFKQNNLAAEQEAKPFKNCEGSLKNSAIDKQNLEKISFSLEMISLLAENAERKRENINASSELSWINRLARTSLHEVRLFLGTSF